MWGRQCNQISCPRQFGIPEFIYGWLIVNISYLLTFSSDYVSRAHEIEIRPSSVRLWHRLFLKLLHAFLSNIGCGFRWTICPDVFFVFFWFLNFFFDIFNEYFWFSLTWEISERYFYKSQPKVFKLVLNFLPNDPHKTKFGIFENSNFNEFYSFSLTWDPMGVKISKRCSYKSQPKVLKFVLNCLPNGPHKTTFGIF